MKNAERDNVREAVKNTIAQIREDWTKMGGLSKALKKEAHKARMKDFQNKAFNKDKK